MSSSNLVRVSFIEESSLGVTPTTGDFLTARFTNENLSGSPETTVSEQIRTDRASSGQIVTGLNVGGSINFELAKENAIDLFFKSALMSDWSTSAAVSVTSLDIDATAKTLTRSEGDWNTDVVVGDIITLDGFTNSENNTQVMVTEITSATVIKIEGPTNLVTEAGGTSFKVADKISVGADKTSFSMEKVFLDLNDKAIIYKGMLADKFNISVSYGAIINGSFEFVGTEYNTVSDANDFITNGRTILAPATAQSFNGSVDMPFLYNSASPEKFCIQSIELNLSNNLNAQNCVGKVAPQSYTEGTAQIEISLSAYLADANWELLAKKLNQEPFSIGFMVRNSDGFYGFFIPAVQVSFDDPASGGQNQDVLLDMKGVARIGLNGEKPLTVFRG